MISRYVKTIEWKLVFTEEQDRMFRDILERTQRNTLNYSVLDQLLSCFPKGEMEDEKPVDDDYFSLADQLDLQPDDEHRKMEPSMGPAYEPTAPGDDTTPEKLAEFMEGRSAIHDATMGIPTDIPTATADNTVSAATGAAVSSDMDRLSKLADICSGRRSMDPPKSESQGAADGDWLQCPVCRKLFVFESKHITHIRPRNESESKWFRNAD